MEDRGIAKIRRRRALPMLPPTNRLGRPSVWRVVEGEDHAGRGGPQPLRGRARSFPPATPRGAAQGVRSEQCRLRRPAAPLLACEVPTSSSPSILMCSVKCRYRYRRPGAGPLLTSRRLQRWRRMPGPRFLRARWVPALDARRERRRANHLGRSLMDQHGSAWAAGRALGAGDCFVAEAIVSPTASN
jgi:hypothetical protein